MQDQDYSQNSNSDISGPPLVYRIKQYKPSGIKQSLSYMLIRPPRFLYNQQLLIPPEKYQTIFQYEEHLIPFKLSLYKVKNMKYVILYLHGNSSSRFQGYMHLKQLPPGVGLACFDFNGCGMRFQSDFITLGKNESKEVDIAARFLKQKGHNVVGWGRSMGSVSLLLSSECDIMIADSPFCSLSQLCHTSSQQFLPSICCCFFHCFYPCVFCCVRSDVVDKSGMDPDELDICKAIRENPKNKNRKLFILAGKEDTMIPYSHAQRIYECFPGVKKIKIFQGSHNSNRPLNVIKQCFIFIEKQNGLEPHPCLYQKQKKSNIKLKPIGNPIQIKIEENKKKQKQNLMSASIMINRSKQLKQDENVKVPEIEKLRESPSSKLKTPTIIKQIDSDITLSKIQSSQQLRRQSALAKVRDQDISINQNMKKRQKQETIIEEKQVREKIIKPQNTIQTVRQKDNYIMQVVQQNEEQNMVTEQKIGVQEYNFQKQQSDRVQDQRDSISLERARSDIQLIPDKSDRS